MTASSKREKKKSYEVALISCCITSCLHQQLAFPSFWGCGAIAWKRQLFIALKNREYFTWTLSYIGTLFYRLSYFVYKLFMCHNLYVCLYSTKTNRSLICRSSHWVLCQSWKFCFGWSHTNTRDLGDGSYFGEEIPLGYI